MSYWVWQYDLSFFTFSMSRSLDSQAWPSLEAWAPTWSHGKTAKPSTRGLQVETRFDLLEYAAWWKHFKLQNKYPEGVFSLFSLFSQLAFVVFFKKYNSAAWSRLLGSCGENWPAAMEASMYVYAVCCMWAAEKSWDLPDWMCNSVRLFSPFCALTVFWAATVKRLIYWEAHSRMKRLQVQRDVVRFSNHID